MISPPRAFIWLKKISIWTNLNFLYSKYIHLLAICIEQTDKLQISYKINFVLFENFFHQMKAYDSLFKLYIKHFTLKFIFLSQIWLLFDLYWDNFYKFEFWILAQKWQNSPKAGTLFQDSKTHFVSKICLQSFILL